MSRLSHRKLAQLLKIALALAALAMIDGIADGDHPAIYRLGLGVAFFAGLGLVVARTGVSDRMLERARLDGYDDGLAASDSACSQLTLLRPSQQLGQQQRVGSGADRIN